MFEIKFQNLETNFCLERHFKQIHKVNTNFECDKCQKIFWWKGHLERLVSEYDKKTNVQNLGTCPKLSDPPDTRPLTPD